MKKFLQFFVHDHLKNEDMKNVVRVFATLAEDLAANLPENPESTVALRKLLEAKDAAVRSLIYRA